MSYFNAEYEKGFSIITVTKRAYCIQQVIDNYKRQFYPIKELIIIINNDKIKKGDFEEKCKNEKNISIYQLPEITTTGNCLNYGCKHAKYKYIAKFDDDDYYGRYYLQEAKDTFDNTDADIVCKKGIFYYLEENEEVIVRFRMTIDSKKVTGGAGSTLCFAIGVFLEIPFSDLRRGSDSDFIEKCKKAGKKIYTNSSYNFFSTRSKNLEQHTWNISNEELKQKADKSFGVKHMAKEELYKFVEKYPAK